MAEQPPALTLKGDGALAVGVDGIVHVVDAGSGQAIRLAADGSVLDRRPVPLDGIDGVQVSAVGDRTVVLDAQRRRVLVPGASPTDVAAVGDGPVLQQPGPANDAGALVAGDGALAAVSLASGAPTVVASVAAGGGQPAAPVFLGGCAYGAWASAATVAEACPGRAPQLHPLGPFAGVLQFRVNRNRVIVNDLRDGVAWLLAKGKPTRIDDWSQALSNDETPEEEKQDDRSGSGVAEGSDTQYNRTAPNRPPEAADDAAAARPGRPTLIEPLANDSDPDFDVLLLAEPEPLPDSDGTLQVIDGGTAFQFTPPPGRTDPVVFRYEVTDGRGGTDTATVTVAMRAEGQNGAPVTKADRTTVEAGRSVAHDVVANDADPDGDGISLVAVSVEPALGTV
ncbi:MAG: Ig-like domain-containing protein, partial [Actinomycetes bacterium]